MPIRLLCDAIPFCYGPAAALETFLKALFVACPDTPEVEVLASGSTLELLDRSGLPIKLLPIDSEDPAALDRVPFGSYDAFFNVCNPASYAVARRSATPIAYLDFLLWMHTGARADHFDADLYLAENYPGTSAWVAQRGHEVANLVVVPPLIAPPQFRRPESGFLLIGLGGLYSRLTIPGRNNNYARYVVRNVLEAIPSGRFSRVVIAGPAQLASLMGEGMPAEGQVEYASLSHDDFVATLECVELFVSHPGLYAAFEAMMSGVPTVFLPPSNYTQVLQLRHYRAAGLAEGSFSWEDAGLQAVPDGLPEAEGVRAVLEVVGSAERSPSVAPALRAVLSAWFACSPEVLAGLGDRQKRAASSFNISGPEVAAGQFLAWISAMRPYAT
jgi:hypothetical protein